MTEKVRSSRQFLVSVLRRLLWAVLIFLGIILMSALAFWGLTDYTLHDSLYWAVVTGFTVGYGDVLPATNAAQNLAMFLIASSAVFWSIVVGHVTAIILGYRERELMCEVQALVNHFNVEVDYSGDGS